jgi:hypothetical protein
MRGYADYHADLFRTVAQNAHASLEQVEDACAFARDEFLRHQPGRDRNWRGWLFRVAQREA